ncbi:MAG: hypothetical protein ACRDPM_12165 [Solirubrobacteraceae bacterium]
MSERARQLHAIADRQVAQLIQLLSTVDAAALRLPCPGREKLGDGTVAAVARHTADNYQRIAAFVQTGDRGSGSGASMQRGAHRVPRLLRGLGHRVPEHAQHGPGGHQENDRYTADGTDPDLLVGQLSAARKGLRQIAALTDSQLDAIPPDRSFRFCDGQRRLEQVLVSLVKHQGHQVAAVESAVGKTAIPWAGGGSACLISAVIRLPPPKPRPHPNAR